MACNKNPDYQSKWNSTISREGRIAGCGVITISTEAGPAGSGFSTEIRTSSGGGCPVFSQNRESADSSVALRSAALRSFPNFSLHQMANWTTLLRTS